LRVSSMAFAERAKRTCLLRSLSKYFPLQTASCERGGSPLFGNS
jgi:hypothetical protein